MEGGGEEFAIGVLISVKTTLGEEFEGQIVSFDRPTNLLVIHILSKSLPIRFSPPPPHLSALPLSLPVLFVRFAVVFVSMTG